MTVMHGDREQVRAGAPVRSVVELVVFRRRWPSISPSLGTTPCSETLSFVLTMVMSPSLSSSAPVHRRWSSISSASNWRHTGPRHSRRPWARPAGDPQLSVRAGAVAQLDSGENASGASTMVGARKLLDKMRVTNFSGKKEEKSSKPTWLFLLTSPTCQIGPTCHEPCQNLMRRLLVRFATHHPKTGSFLKKSQKRY